MASWGARLVSIAWEKVKDLFAVEKNIKNPLTGSIFCAILYYMKLIYQPLGTVTLVGIESSVEQEVIEQYYSFWNHEATGGKLHWMCDNFAYITTSEKKLENYFLNSSLALILNKYPTTYKGVKGGAMEAAKQLAARRLEELKENQEVFMNTNPMVYDYSLGRTEARENPAQVKPFDEEEYKQKAAASSSRLETA